MNKITLAVTAAAAVVYAVLIASIPFRIKKIDREKGALLMQLKSEPPFRNIAVLVIAALLIGIVPFRNFALYLGLIFDATALLAAWMSVKEIASSGRNGVFENMIISETTAICYDDILSLPTVSYENDEETTQVDFRILEVIPKKGRKIQLIFPDETTRNTALEFILKQCPRLKG